MRPAGVFGVELWVREIGAPKSIEWGRTPPGPGDVVFVARARSAREARKILSEAQAFDRLYGDKTGAEIDALLEGGSASDYGRLRSSRARVRVVCPSGGEWVSQ